MPPNATKPTTPRQADRLREVVQISSPDSFHNSRNLDELRAAWVARRYDLARPVAAVVAGLALGGAL